jgi:hypothetical protein
MGEVSLPTVASELPHSEVGENHHLRCPSTLTTMNDLDRPLDDLVKERMPSKCVRRLLTNKTESQASLAAERNEIMREETPFGQPRMK